MTDEIRLATSLIRNVVQPAMYRNLCERISCLLNRIKMLMAMPQVSKILPPTTKQKLSDDDVARQVIMPPLTRPRPLAPQLVASRRSQPKVHLANAKKANAKNTKNCAKVEKK